MTMLGRLWNAVFTAKTTKPTPAKGEAAEPRRRSKFDSAQTGAENREHWRHADDLSANAAADPATRRTLRRRSRYERDNDPHIDGLTEALADDMIGTGPRLQLNLGEEHYAAARDVMKSFRLWCRAVGLAGKLRLLHEAKPTDGESFGQFVTNAALPNLVKLDIRLFETDQVETPGFDVFGKPNAISGIEFDQDGNPEWYHVLKQHPGDSDFWNWSGESTRVAARFILHWFRQRRAGQARGLPKLTSALNVSSQGRRFALATLAAAEYAASVNAVLESDAPPPDPDDDGDDETADARPKDWSEVNYRRNTLLVTPGGTKLKQIEAEHPTANYGEFMDRQHGTIGRSVRAPLNMVTGSSASFNFASGRLDGLPYQSMVWIERDDFEQRIVDRIFLAWVQEAQLVGLIPDGLPAVNEWEWVWHWDAFEQLDPLKEAKAVELQLRLKLITLSEACAAKGLDWREVLDQTAVEDAYMLELEAKRLALVKELEAKYGVTFAAPAPPAAEPAAPDPNDEALADA